MNVMTVSRPLRKRQTLPSLSPNRTRIIITPSRKEWDWQDLAEVLLFGLIALVSSWPVLAAFDAIVALK